MSYDWKVTARKAALAAAFVMLAAVAAQCQAAHSLRPLGDLGFWDKQGAAGLAAAIAAVLASASNLMSFAKAAANGGK